MVWEVKCDNCGEIINWGGSEPSEYGPEDPEDMKMGDEAIKFDDKTFCKACVKKFVKFGVGDVEDRVDFLESKLEDVMDAMGMEKNLNPGQ